MASDVTPEPFFALRDLEVAYDGIVVALRGVTLSAERGSIVSLLGANGAGKSTTLRAALGLLRARRGALTAGSVWYRGERVDGRSARAHVLSGIAEVLEGRHCFAHLTVEQNLVSGTLARRRSRADVRRALERVYTYFPRLRDKRALPAGYTSGGEQQMIAIGRALASDPSLVLLDEPSMGLAPRVVGELFEIIRALNQQEGITFVLAEQNANLALRYASHAYVLENGRVVLSGSAAELAQRADIRELYLGAASVRRPAEASAMSA